MRDQSIPIADLNRLRLRIESKPEVVRDWYKGFRPIQYLRHGSYPKRFPIRAQAAEGSAI
jgi:hypothetical protein